MNLENLVTIEIPQHLITKDFIGFTSQASVKDLDCNKMWRLRFESSLIPREELSDDTLIKFNKLLSKIALFRKGIENEINKISSNTVINKSIVTLIKL